ncbi:hypothetical protein K470DRAFT_282814 [Piedraia hortae CBS 480.64]|uniref:BTB domain-containing protein n=1 Tax=Piedraia hortae CBS 480.64 TaxID=1314780 RepID=A0A6A7BW03_9PEZI|nr:hypothetical protein K470DRAFT_282814 [Piedraia hortae CBS 480.64]
MADHSQERPLHELLSRDMVDIYVGPENTHWILHEKLLCYRSRFFRKIFYYDNKTAKYKNHTYGVPEEEDGPFRLFVGWLYSEQVPPARHEEDLAWLFDLYLMGEKWEIKSLQLDVLEAVRQYYHDNDTWPELRRVQYIYANTAPESPMRELLMQCVARMLVLREDGLPAHWEKALRHNGPLAVDIILCVQKWHALEADRVPDVREESVMSFVDELEHRAEVIGCPFGHEEKLVHGATTRGWGSGRRVGEREN